MNFRDKVALLTGGARIGQAVADALARRGCHVAVSYRSSRSSALETVRQAKNRGVRALAVQADVGQPAECRRLVKSVVRVLGRLDILINMASLYEKTPLASLRNPPAAARAFDRQIAVDLQSAYTLSLLAAPAMERAGGGRIVLFSDWVAASGRPRYRGYIPYYTAKAGVKALTETLALELAPKILVNAVAPGPILAPPRLSAAAGREVLANTPLHRWGGAAEIAKAVLFFIDSDFVTGETLRVDGGRHLY